MIIKTSIPGLADSLVIPLQNKVNDLTNEIIDINQAHKQEIYQLTKEHNEYVDALNTEYEIQLQNLNNDINDLNNSITNKDIIINDKNTQIDQLNNININLTTQVEELNTEIEDLNNRLQNSSLPLNTTFGYSRCSTINYLIKECIEHQEDCSYAFYGSKIENIELDLYNAIYSVNMFASGGNGYIGDYTLNQSSQLQTAKINFHKTSNANGMFEECLKLTSVELNGKFREVDNMFNNCNKLEEIKGNLDFSECSRLAYVFYGCYNLKELPDLSNLSELSSVYYAFANCYSIKEIPYLNTQNSLEINYCISNCWDLERFNGLSAKSTAASVEIASRWGDNFKKLRYALVKDLGTNSLCTISYFQLITTWGINTTEIPDARQSLIDTLITYSYDRAAAGYSTHTINLHKDTKALLTDEEIAQITAKGFTIA